ncbi:MAG TPA: signal peptidase I [Thermoanaerobaculia bacterium]|nr:signal peptidase I [Thermoanaerobaculia bacterium]
MAVFLSLAALQARAVFGVRMPNASMEPTLRAGQSLQVQPMSLPLVAALQRGDTVLFEAPSQSAELLVKRIVGLPGDVLEIRGKQLYRNREEIDEAYAAHLDPEVHRHPGSDLWRRDQLSPTSVPEAHFYVLGDNRDRSYDSRSFGPVPAASIIGRVL